MVVISVIIVNYNARYFLKNCLDSVLSSNLVDKIEIIVVDNNSTDGSSTMVKEDFPEVTYLQNTENVGFSKANNRGASLAKGKYILILNPDTILGETTLTEVFNFSEKQANFGAAGVHFVDGSGKYLPEGKRNFPNLKVAGAKLLGYSKYYYAHHIANDDIAETDILTGAFMFINKDVYEQVKGFDENFFMYGEDIDLSYRISQAGYRNFYIGSSKVIHFKGESTIKDESYLRNFYGALSIFYKKHFPKKKLSYGVIDMLISAMITVKSVGKSSGTKKNSVISSWVYLGENDTLYESLKVKFPDGRYAKSPAVDNLKESYEMIFFDSRQLGFSGIIDAISNAKLSRSKKRIISKDQTFILGSDSSGERGVVKML